MASEGSSSGRWLRRVLGLSILLNVTLALALLRLVTRHPRIPATAVGRSASRDKPSDKPWRVVTEKLTGSIRAVLIGQEGVVGAIAFSGDGTLLAVATEFGRVTLWELKDKSITWKSNLGPGSLGAEESLITAIAFSPDSRSLAYLCSPSSGSNRIRVVDIDSARTRVLLSGGVSHIEDGPISLAFIPDGVTLAVGSRSGIDLVDLRSGQIQGSLYADRSSYYSHLSASSSRPGLLASTRVPASVLVFDRESKESIAVLKCPENERGQSALIDLALSPDGKYVAASSMGNEAFLWESTTGRQIASVREGQGTGWVDRRCWIAFTPDGSSLLTTSEGPEGGIYARRRDVRTGDLVSQIKLTQLGEPYPYTYPKAISPDGKAVVSLWAGKFREENDRCCHESYVVIHDITRLSSNPSTDVMK